MTTTTVGSGTTRTSQVTLSGGDALLVQQNGTLGYTGTASAAALNGGSGNVTITDSGTITALASGARGIDDNKKTLGAGTTLTVTLNTGASLSSNDDAVRVKNDFGSGAVTIANSGTLVSGTISTQVVISGTASGQAIDLANLTSPAIAVTITNNAGALIGAANADAVRPSGGAGATVNNYGTIIGEALGGNDSSDGVDFQDTGSGTVNNYTGGIIIGARHGITGKLPLLVTNAGTIMGQLGSGINLDTQPTTVTTVTNDAGGVIVGTASGSNDGDGIDVDGLVAIDNAGTIQALGTWNGGLSEAITVGGGTIVNHAGGILTSVQRAITIDDSNLGNAFAATTIINEGTIHGVDSTADNNLGAISITDTYADTLTNKGVIEGSVALGGGDDVVNLYTGSSLAGTIDGGAGTDTINLLGAGTGSFGAATNVEALILQGGTWRLTAANAYSAGVTLKCGTLDLAVVGAVGGGAITFAAGTASTLALEAGADPTNTITGFDGDDTFFLAGFDGATTHADLDDASDVLTIADQSGHSATLQLAGDYTGHYFHAATQSGGVALNEDNVACFARGTRILTERGETPVESLVVGERLVAKSGLEAIKWIGRRSYGRRFAAGQRHILPVCIKAGALGENLPRRDLWISPQHAMLIDGVLVEAKDLVDGLSVIQPEVVDRIEYFHVELDRHDTILAEGAWSETFIDDDSRGMFHNAAEYARLYRDDTPADARYCAPRVADGERLETIRRAITARATATDVGRHGFIDERNATVLAAGRATGARRCA